MTTMSPPKVQVEDLIGLEGNIGRSYLEPTLVIDGQEYEVPKEVSDPEDRFNMNSEYPVREGYKPEIYLPLLSSHFSHEGCFDGEGAFCNMVEEVYSEAAGHIQEHLEEYEEWGDEEYLDNYGEVALAFTKFVKEKVSSVEELGLCWSYEVKNGELNMRVLLGDGHYGDEKKGDPDTACFTKEELSGMTMGDFEELDRGIGLTYMDISWSDLDGRVLGYSLGLYLWNQLKEQLTEEQQYSNNQTETLLDYLTTADQEVVEELGLEEEVALWLETIKGLSK